ncbi:MAG: hypothetical protein M1834_005407 [Cirrosporium novae-zelandiae]|nr:MAG: hypothetical protein M1834_005407 [Cirrosporium novae-zelandiae]
MGAGTKIASVVLRVFECACAIVVTAILGRYIYYVDLANAHAGSRVVYTLSIACISILFSILLGLFTKYSFWLFPVDFALFICWMTAFGLLRGLTGGHGCNSYWYWHSWGFFWGRWWRTVPITRASGAIVGRSACGVWESVLAFSFIGGFLWLINGIIGVVMFLKEGLKKPMRRSEMGSVENK